ncbi:NYN domain-containing protein [Candidatus Uhrbacteria bacterium]|nr:NYN domain-containing protein [Candidatus Uhrbacteria bacterium]
MGNKQTATVYIDGANLHKGIHEIGWKLDYRRFRVWLYDKFGTERVYLFLGLVPKFAGLYRFLQEAGFTLVFKETVHDSTGKVKGNCDAELVLTATRDFYEHRFEQAVLVTGDGDFGCLASFLLQQGKLRAIIAPNRGRCSYFLRRIQVPLIFLNDLESVLAEKEKAPGADETAQGSFSSL